MPPSELKEFGGIGVNMVVLTVVLCVNSVGECPIAKVKIMLVC